MKDKNGIEIKCENCKDCENHLILCADRVDNSIKCFNPTTKAFEARIAELEAELKRREFKPIVEADFKVSPQFPKERELFRGKYKIVDTGEELFAVFVKDSLEYSAYTLDEINKWAVKQIAKLNKEQKELGGCNE